MIMGLISDMVTVSYQFIEDFMYWNKPDKSLMLIKAALLSCVALFVTFMTIPL